MALCLCQGLAIRVVCAFELLTIAILTFIYGKLSAWRGPRKHPIFKNVIVHNVDRRRRDMLHMNQHFLICRLMVINQLHVDAKKTSCWHGTGFVTIWCPVSWTCLQTVFWSKTDYVSQSSARKWHGKNNQMNVTKHAKVAMAVELFLEYRPKFINKLC